MYKVILILHKFFFKYESGDGQTKPPPEKTTSQKKKPSLIMVKRKQ